MPLVSCGYLDRAVVWLNGAMVVRHRNKVEAWRLCDVYSCTMRCPLAQTFSHLFFAVTIKQRNEGCEAIISSFVFFFHTFKYIGPQFLVVIYGIRSIICIRRKLDCAIYHPTSFLFIYMVY